MEQIAEKETTIYLKEVDEIKVRQEARTLEIVKNTLVDARFHLGADTRFTKLAEMIEDAINKAASEATAADDYLNERM